MDTDLLLEPGKFEGCPRWVRYYWDLSLAGLGEDFYTDVVQVGDDEWEPGGTLVSYFRVDGEEVEKYPDLDGVEGVWIWEDSQGFVIAKTNRQGVADYFGIPVNQVVPG